MLMRLLLGLLAASSILLPQFAEAAAPTAVEIAEARQWTAARFEADHETKGVGPFFSFTYGARPSAELLAHWRSSFSAAVPGRAVNNPMPCKLKDPTPWLTSDRRGRRLI